MSAQTIQALSEPVHFTRSGKTAINRFLKSAMTERLCSWDDNDLQKRGKPTPEYIRLYEEWGKGQIGTIILGNIPVNFLYPEAKKNACIDPTSKWDVVEAFKPVIRACKASGSLVIGQLTHAGRQTSNDIQTEPVSSSDVQCPPAMGMKFNKPRPMTKEEIKDTVERWAFGAKVLYDAGADGAQLHGAHGYLLSQFLSPRVNTRTDEYGGDLTGRSRIVFETIDAIKKAVNDPKFIIAIKINSADFAEGGFNSEESKEMAVRLEEAGVDLIELSGGTYESGAFEHKKESTKKREAYFVEFSDQIRPYLSKAKLAVTGGFRTAEPMAQAVQQGTCDIIGLARPLCAEPYLCRDILAGKTKGAKANLVPAALQTPTAIAQIHDIGSGRIPPTDLSIQENADKAVQAVTGSKPQPAHGDAEEYKDKTA